MAVTDVLSGLSRNGVIVVDELKRANYPLYRYLMSNKESIVPDLKGFGVHTVFRRSPMTDEKAINLIKYYYGNNVNLLRLRRHHRYLYNYICKKRKGVANVLDEWGFSTINKQEVKLYRRLNSLTPNQPIDKDTYNRIYYRAKKMGLTVSEFIDRYTQEKEAENDSSREG